MTVLSSRKKKHGQLWLTLLCIILVHYTTAQEFTSFPERNIFSNYPTYTDDDSVYMESQIRIGQDLQTDSAIIFFQDLMQYCQIRLFLNGTVQAANRLTDAYAQKGMINEGHKLLADVIIFARHFPAGKEYLSDLHCNIASLHIFEGAYEKAIKSYFRAIYYADRNPKQTYGSLSRLYNNVANAFNIINERGKAHYYLDVADSFARRGNDSVEIGYILLNRGEFFNAEKKYEESKYQYMASLQLAGKLKNNELYYVTLISLSGLYTKTGYPQKAIALLHSADTPAVGLYTSPFYKARLLRTLGEAYMKTDAYVPAERYYRQALELTAPGSSHAIQTHYSLAQLYNIMGDYKKAFRSLAAYHTIKDSLSYTDQVRNSTELEVRYRTAHKDNELIKKELEISRQQHNLEQKNRWIAVAGSGVLVLIALLVSLSLKRKLEHKQIAALQQEQEITRLRALVEGEEKERTRLARELHDGIGGMLAAINMNVNALHKRHQELEDLPNIIKMVKTTTEEVRKTAHNLMPDVLARHNLTEAVRLYCEQVNASGSLHITLSFAGLANLHKSIELILYRIVQELVQNIIKHARATEAFVEIQQTQDKVFIIVEDNGKGFDTSKNEGGFGIQNLMFRIKSLQGDISIESFPGSGTTINISFDLPVLKSIMDHEHQNSYSG